MNQRRVNLEKERFWTDRIKRQGESGLSIRAFCAAESISEASFHWWRRELARRKSPGRRKPLRHGQQPSPAWPEVAQLVPVTVTSSPCPVIEVILPGGAVVRVPEGCSLQPLREVLAALEANRC